MAVTFFDPVAISGLGIGTNWVLQSGSPSTSRNRAQGLKTNGDEAASQLYGGQTSQTLEFKNFQSSGDTGDSGNAIPSAGKCASGWHVDSVSVSYSPTDWPTLSVQVHKHDDCETGVTSHASQANTYTASLELPMGFGVPSDIKTIVGISDSTIGLSAFSYEMSVTHQDEVGGSGNYLASEDRDGSESASVSTVGVPSADPDIDGWDMLSDSTNASNTTADTATYSFEHHVQRDEDDED